jgi:probable F420-dependent oxidoreductase
MDARYGMSIPLGNLPLSEQRGYIEQLARDGYTDVWSSEVSGTDAFTPLTLTSVWAPTLRLGTAIVPSFTRGPGVMAQSVASLASAAPGRFAFGLGSSSDIIVESWNAQPFNKPYSRTRDMLHFLKAALTGEKVTETYDTFKVRGFRLGAVPPVQPPILVAALREKMLELGASDGDGVILNWLSADDVKTVAPYVHRHDPAKEIVCRIFVCPSDDAETVRAGARQFIAAYLNVGVYADYQRWLGRTEILAPMQARWAAGDRQGALTEIPDEVVDDLIVHGTPAQCKSHIARYVENGVTTPALAIMPWGPDPIEAAALLAPNAS